MVDVNQLNSILSNGILPLSKLDDQEWLSNKRANNSKDVVYLYDPNQEGDAFPQTYGLALLEIEVENATKNKMADNDTYKNRYTEYIVSEVKPEQIKNIYLPIVLKDRLSDKVKGLDVTWVNVSIEFMPVKGRLYFGDEYTEVTDQKELSKLFWSTTPLNTDEYNYFRGSFKLVDENSPLVNPPSVSYPVDAKEEVKYLI